MIFQPSPLGNAKLDAVILKEDLRHCRKFGPCGVGKKALYLNSFYISRRYYLPLQSVKRVYKRVAMSKGGFTGKGVFASIPYLVVEYEDGKEKQCIFKVEDMVDQMIGCIHEACPEIPLHSRTAQKRLDEKKRLLDEKLEKLKNAGASEDIRLLQQAAAYLEKKPLLYEQLSRAAHEKRVQEKTNPAYRYAAIAIIAMGAVSFGYGIYSLLHHLGNAMYFLLFGLTAIFLFSGANVLPTGKRNAASVQRRLEETREAMRQYIEGWAYERVPKGPKPHSASMPSFPVPAYYAHPVVLQWMQQILAEQRADSIEDALSVLKDDLRSLNASVTVEQETYDDVIKIKPLFLVMDYR